MKKLIVSILVFIVTLHVVPYAFAATLEKTGKCTLKVAKPFDNKNIYKTTLRNEDIIVKCEFRGGDFFNEFVMPLLSQANFKIEAALC